MEDHNSCVDKKQGFTDFNSNVNNNASIDDVRDFLHIPNPTELNTFRQNTQRSLTASKTPKKQAKKAATFEQAESIINFKLPDTGLELKIMGALNEGVVRNQLTSAKNVQ